MATANVTVKIEGLDGLEVLVKRLEEVVERIAEIERPLYGDVHLTAYPDAEINLHNSGRL